MDDAVAGIGVNYFEVKECNCGTVRLRAADHLLRLDLKEICAVDARRVVTDLMAIICLQHRRRN
jgi:hypothetical protein